MAASVAEIPDGAFVGVSVGEGVALAIAVEVPSDDSLV